MFLIMKHGLDHLLRKNNILNLKTKKNMNNVNFIYTKQEHSAEDNIKEYIDSLPKDSIFYDLGANLGWFSLYAANLGLQVYAFEVDKNNFFGLQKNIEANPNLLDKIFIFNQGIADKKRNINLRFSDDTIGGHHKTLELPNFSATSGIIANKKIEIIVDSLDNIIKDNNLPFPDHLKVDIDGSEYAFLLGANEILNHAKSMVIEFWTESEYYNESIRILNTFGFKQKTIYPIFGESNLYNFVFEK